MCRLGRLWVWWLVVLWVGCGDAINRDVVVTEEDWPGVWSNDKYLMYVCLDKTYTLNGLALHADTSTPLYSISGVVDPSSLIATGRCDPFPKSVHFLMGYGYHTTIWPGSTLYIELPSNYIYPINVTVIVGKMTLWEHNNLTAGEIAVWQTDIDLSYYVNVTQEMFLLYDNEDNNFHINVSISVEYFGRYFLGKVDTRNTQLRTICSLSPSDLTVFESSPGTGDNRNTSSLYPVSNYVTALQCGEYYKVWIGSWRININISFPFSTNGYSRTANWWVCSTRNNTLISSFGGVQSVWNDTFYPYFLVNNDVVVTQNSISGTFFNSSNPNITGSFAYYLDSDVTKFTGYIWFMEQTYGVTGSSASSESPLSFYCSPYYRYAGVWLESRYSSNMYICVDYENNLYGSFLGNAFTFTGQFKRSPDTVVPYWIRHSFLELTVMNVRNGGQYVMNVLLELNKHQATISLDDDSVGTTLATIVATLQSSTETDCSAVPTFWGKYEDTNFQSMYLCYGKNNAIYGVLPKLNGTIIATVTDRNKVSGVLQIPQGTYQLSWTFNLNGSISAIYINENGLLTKTYIQKITDYVSDSRCNGTVLVDAYAGKFNFGEANASICISDNYVVGTLEPYYLTGTYYKGIVSGTYTKSNNETGSFTAEMDLDETVLTIYLDGTELKGNKTKEGVSGLECGSWQPFYAASFGLSSNNNNIFGGCITLCFDSQVDFRIIFHNSGIHGNGTLDLFTGQLSGQLQNNNYQFVISPKTENSISVLITPDFNETEYGICNTTVYPGVQYQTSCTPTSFEPVLYLPASGSLPRLSSTRLPIGSDISDNGNVIIVASGNDTYIMENNGHWQSTQIPVQQFYLERPEYDFLLGSPVVVTDTNAFSLSGNQVAVFTKTSLGVWNPSGYLTSPCSNCQPLHLVKSFPTKYLEVTWGILPPSNGGGSFHFWITLYNITNGFQYNATYTITTTDLIYAVSISTHWLAYSSITISSTATKNLYTCPMDDSLRSLTCSSLILYSGTVVIEILQGASSLSVGKDFLFIGNPMLDHNQGFVDVYQYVAPVWKHVQTILPPDSGYYQEFGTMVTQRDDTILIQKSHDNSAKPFSVAFFLYEYKASKWVPKSKLVSEYWPSSWQTDIPLPVNKKRQYIARPPFDVIEGSYILWAMSNNGSLFFSSSNLDGFTFSRYICENEYWGYDCSSPCTCYRNSTCTSDILGFACSCLSNTWGQFCENLCPECNGALCSDGTMGNGTCLCNTSQYGPNCLPCLCLGGVCSNGTNGTGECSCFPGWNGRYCDNPTMALSKDAIIAIATTIPILFVVVLLGVFCFVRRSDSIVIDLTDFPEELRWFFDSERIKSESGWNHSLGDDFFSKNVEDDKKYSKRLTALLEKLDGQKIAVEKAYAIFNQTLLNNFVGYRKVLSQRHRDSPQIFKKPIDPDTEQRAWVYQQFQNKVNSFEWNKELTEDKLFIMAAIHGTDLKIAKSICGTGFAALSSLDKGYYGKGIYVTSSCLYALPYYGPKPNPSFLVCLVTPGNSFPVTENISETVNYLGVAIDNGYQSHYIVTTKDGKALNKIPTKKFYDELVLPAEGQLLPLFLVVVDKSKISGLLSKFQREIAENTVAF